jgi:hypothetical protein
MGTSLMRILSFKRSACLLPALSLAFLLPGSSSATVLFSEDFSGATPGTYGTTIPGAQFTVTEGNVDVFGILNGRAFNCTDNINGNCLDLIGNVGIGQITSIPTFSVIAGDTYTITYGVNSQGVTQTLSFSVALGSLSTIETATDATGNETVTFTPTTSQSGAALVFTSITNVNNVNGPVLSDIVLTQTAPVVSPAPEPASLALAFTGLFATALGAVRSRKKRLTAAL